MAVALASHALESRPRSRLTPWPEETSYLQTMRQMADADLFFFCREVLGFNLLEAEPHGALCAFLMRPASSGRRQKLILMPRGSFKSSVVTVGYLLWQIGRDSSSRNLVDSDLRANAKKFAGLIRWHLESNVRFKQLYGDLRREPGWTEDYFTCKREHESKEPTVDTSGMDRVIVGLHYDRIVCDDLVNNTNVRNRDQIENTLEHFRLLAPVLELPEINPDVETLVAGTRWDDQDLYGSMLQSSGMTETEMQTRLGEGEASFGDWDVFFRTARWKERPLFAMFTEDFLTRKLRDMGPFLFAAQYELDPVPLANATFSKDWFRVWEPPLPEFTQVLGAVDPALGEKSFNDYSAMVTVGVTAKNELYVLEAWKDKVNPKELIDHIMRSYDEFRHDQLGLEEHGMQRMMGTALREEMGKQGTWLPLKSLKPSPLEGKVDRIRGLIPFYANGAVFHGPHMSALETELARFPRKKAHDDLIDALAYVVQQMLPAQQITSDAATYEPDSWVTGY